MEINDSLLFPAFIYPGTAVMNFWQFVNYTFDFAIIDRHNLTGCSTQENNVNRIPIMHKEFQGML